MVRTRISEIEEGDTFFVNGYKHIADNSAHQNFDEPDEPWIVYDEDDNSWFEEDIDTVIPEDYIVERYIIVECTVRRSIPVKEQYLDEIHEIVEAKLGDGLFDDTLCKSFDINNAKIEYGILDDKTGEIDWCI